MPVEPELTGTPGKRTSTSDPLTEHDVAERLDRAAARVLTILIHAREMGILDLVKRSRYLTNLTNSLSGLAAELLAEWGIEPVALRPMPQSGESAPPGKPSSITCPKCRMTSYNPNDIQWGYCGNCHDFTSPPAREAIP